MKITYFKIKKTSALRRITTNLIILVLLLTVFAFSYAGGALNAFNSKSSVEAIYKGNTSGNNVSLMFNVYWGDEYLEPILEVLKQKNVTTTFFVGGVWASKNSDFLNMILEYNCELGNHGYVHKDQNKINQQENFDEINLTHQLVKSFTGVEMNLFAPPSGAFNNTTLTVAESLGYKTIMWTKDTIDWRDKDANLIFNRATKNASGGDLVLMHPTAKTLEALPGIIDFFKSQNLNITTVSNTIA
ncbi:MAG: polysaccharide deacetylase family protein [Clostridia bacterium]|nr:polysaccharide deacetylase family protein [Clostridia bacterium]